MCPNPTATETTMKTKTYTTRRQAMDAVTELLGQHLPLIPGLRAGADRTLADLRGRVENGTDYLNIEWSRSFGVGCSLSIGLRAGRVEREEERVIYHARPVVEVNWSGTSRSPAESMAAIALYQHVTQLACLVETVLARLEIAEVPER